MLMGEERFAGPPGEMPGSSAKGAAKFAGTGNLCLIRSCLGRKFIQ
jgi:hypothetical protein